MLHTLPIIEQYDHHQEHYKELFLKRLKQDSVPSICDLIAKEQYIKPSSD
jgi:hypothetical protein